MLPNQLLSKTDYICNQVYLDRSSHAPNTKLIYYQKDAASWMDEQCEFEHRYAKIW